jgi:hypothetical protein
MFPKLFIGPMSKNIVDTAIELATQGWSLGFIPSRRQIDNSRGYVNNWSTKEFADYVRERTDKILIQRDHGGPSQGQVNDDGLESLQDDARNNLDLIHVDPWKKFEDIDSAVLVTMLSINACCESSDNNCNFEVGTEQAIRKYSPSELEVFLNKLKRDLGERFNRIKFAVIQSGVGLSGTTNTGVFDEKRCEEMISVCKDFNLLSKEHNGDYLKKETIKRRFELGLDAINIAPELGVEETRCVLHKIEEEGREDLFERFFKACHLSRLWLKWLPDGFFPADPHEKRLLVEVSGHYIFNTDEFRDITKELSGLQELIKLRLSDKIKRLYEGCSVLNRDGRR